MSMEGTQVQKTSILKTLNQLEALAAEFQPNTFDCDCCGKNQWDNMRCMNCGTGYYDCSCGGTFKNGKCNDCDWVR